MLTIDDIFSELGGPAKVGRMIGKTTEHAASMRRRGSIPLEYWPKILEAARELDLEQINIESLAAANMRGTAESAA